MYTEGPKVTYHIRIGPLDEKLASDLAGKFKKFGGILHNKKQGKGPIIIFILNEDSEILKIKKELDYFNIDRDKVDLFISMLTDLDTYIIDIPFFIEEAIKKINMRITFSYTFLDNIVD